MQVGIMQAKQNNMKTTFKSLAAGLAMMIATATVTPSFSNPSHTTVLTTAAVQKNHSAAVKSNTDRKTRREAKKKAKEDKKLAKAQAKQSSGKSKTATK
jgi:hypothetical protein